MSIRTCVTPVDLGLRSPMQLFLKRSQLRSYSKVYKPFLKPAHSRRPDLPVTDSTIFAPLGYSNLEIAGVCYTHYSLRLDSSLRTKLWQPAEAGKIYRKPMNIGMLCNRAGKRPSSALN